MMRISIAFLVVLASEAILCQNQVEIKRARRPNRADHLLCRQKNSGLGIRSSAVLNYSGELCKTYCRVVNRINRTTTYVEFVAPNNVRCGPFGAKCIEGVCTPASGPSGAITDADGSSTGDRIGRPLNGVGYGRRVRPGRRSTVNPVKTTSLSTIEVTNIETEGPTTGAVADAESEADTIRAKIVFPND